jgi:prepilin signal peptidase PulO-like enzyme (type II secretory pathway)
MKRSLVPSAHNKSFQVISLVAGLLGIVDIALRHLGSEFTLADLSQICLLILLCTLVIFELEIIEMKKTRYLSIKMKFAIPLILGATGISIIGKSPSQIENTILGGVLNLLIFFLIDKISRIALGHWGFDQATIIAGFLGGLMVGFEKGIFLVFLASIFGSIVYFPYLYYKKFVRKQATVSQAIPFLPFLIVTAVFMQTPYYGRLDLYVNNLGHKRCIDMIVESVRNGTLKMDVANSDVPVSISVTYCGANNKEGQDTLGYLSAAYHKQDPVIKYSFWRTFLINSRSKGDSKDYKVFHDLTNSAHITVRPIYYLTRIKLDNASITNKQYGNGHNELKE